MSISTEITRISKARNAIRTKLIELGLADTTSKIDELATAVEGIVNQGAVQATVVEGKTYTIPAGYHNGSGTVTGLSDTTGDAAKYKLQTKSATPTKKQQSISPDAGYYGLSSVTVAAIPAAYQDVTSVTAEAGDVLTGSTFVTSDGTVTAGTMPNIGSVSKVLTPSTTSYTIDEGYHDGTGVISIQTEKKTATPTKEQQTISPSTNKVLSSVTVEPIPDSYIETTIDVDTAALAGDILDGKSAYVNGELVEGSMPNNGAATKKLDTTTTSYDIAAGYHNGSGSVSITLETKTVTPTKAIQNIVPTEGKVLSKVTVNAIPADYITTTDADATDENILLGKIAYVKGARVVGSMPNNDTISGTIDGLSTTSFEIPLGYTAGGTVSLTSDIETALAAI